MRLRGLALAVILTGLGAAIVAQGSRVALVIGNGAYSRIPTLSNPANDANDVAAKLADLGFNVTKLVDVKLADMETARQKFALDARSASMRLFYYAGHGVQADGTNWLIPTDADVQEDYELKLKAFSAQAVLDGLKAAGPGMNIVILDACRDNPFRERSRSAGASRGLAVMGISGSLIVYATGPNSTAADGSGRNGVFTEALLERLDSPGLSLQEIMTNVAADVVERTKGAQEPWKQDNLTKMVYFVTPEEAKARFASRLAQDQSELDALSGQLEELRGKLAGEQDAAKRAALDLEIKKQAALKAQKQQEADALKAERARQEQASKDQAAMDAQLASFKEAAASREDAIRQAAEAKRKELEALKTGQGGFLPFIISIETARSAMSDLAARYDASLASIKASVSATFDQKLSALSSWSMDPWENEKEFKARVAAEQARLMNEKQASLSEVTARNEEKKRAALASFDEAEAAALAGLDAVHSTYKGSMVKLEIGAFDRDEKYFPVTIASAAPELPYSASFRYSIKSETTDELKRRYLEFDDWRKAGALFGEIDSSVFFAQGTGFVTLVDGWRVKAVDASGERLLYESTSPTAVVACSGSGDWGKGKPLGPVLIVVAPGAKISVNGQAYSGRDRVLIKNPKPGRYSIQASLPNGMAFDEKHEVGSSAKVVRIDTGAEKAKPPAVAPLASAAAPASPPPAATAQPVVSTAAFDFGPGKLGKIEILQREFIPSARADALRDYVSAWSKRSQIGVKLQINRPEAYDTRLLVSAAAGDLPDVFAIMDREQLDRMIESGMVADLSAEKWASKTPLVYKLGGRVYGLSLEANGLGMIYNEEILKKASVNAASLTSFDGYKKAFAAIDAVKSKLGLRSVVSLSASAETSWWLAGKEFNAFLGNGLPYGDQSVLNELFAGKVDRTRLGEYANWIELLFKYTDKDLLLSGNLMESINAFAQQKTAFLLQGGWYDEILQSMGAHFPRALAPLGSMNKKTEGVFVGNSVLYAVAASKNRKNQALAKKFLEDLALSPEGNRYIVAGRQASPFLDAPTAEMSPASRSLQSWISSGKVYSMNSSQLPKGFTQNTLAPIYAKFASGEIDKAAFVGQMYAALSKLPSMKK
jgi:raffinose/stachyose/melibiose transport system substrate-binding protein